MCFSIKSIKTLLLDGRYYTKAELYAYWASNAEIISSQREIDYYLSDFDGYFFDTIEDHIEVEKRNYIRWSILLEEASKDLVRLDNGKYRWHASGFTANGAL